MMQEKWGMFRESMGELTGRWKNFSDLIKGRHIIQDGILRYNMEATQAVTTDLPLPTSVMEASALSYLLNPTHPMNHSEGSASGARRTTVPPDSSPTKAKAPFWRKIFRCSKKSNTNSADKHTSRDGTAPAPSDSFQTHKSKIPFWRKFIRYLKRNNSTRGKSESVAPTHPNTTAVPSSDPCHGSRTETSNLAGTTSDLNYATTGN